MSKFVGYDNGNLNKYAIILYDHVAWSEYKGRVGFYRDDYLTLLEQFDDSCSFWDDVVPIAEDYAESDDLLDEYPDGFSLEIEEYSPTCSHSILDTIIVYPDGSFEHDNITTQGYGTDHMFD